jgi:pimeloyl-ACP methyl ester carboxylesterase
MPFDFAQGKALPVRTDDVHGRTLRYSRFGQGPPVVLLHGYPDNLHMWSAVGPLLADSFEVIAIDWPGMGGSAAWPGGATPFDMTARLIALLDDWRIDRAAVIGLDMGGQPAAVAAARYPQRISHLVVSGSLLQFDARTSWEIDLLRRFGSISSFSGTHRGSSSGAHGRPPSRRSTRSTRPSSRISRTASAKTQCVSSSSGCARDTREPCRGSSRSTGGSRFPRSHSGVTETFTSRPFTGSG